MKICIVGYGYVGKSIYNLLELFEHDIYIHDPRLGYNYQGIIKCDLTFICVPTESKENGDCDTSIVEETVKWVTTDLIVIKSTVPPGTTEYLRKKYNKKIVFSPEFVGETKYGDSALNYGKSLLQQSHYIFGGLPEHTTKVVDIYKEMCGPDKEYIQTDSTTAELTKYSINSFFFTKLIFFYEYHEYCKEIGVDTNTVRELVIQDPRINKWHTAVFNSNINPVGGKCLPKDTIGFINDCKRKGYSPKLLEKAFELNKKLGKRKL